MAENISHAYVWIANLTEMLVFSVNSDVFNGSRPEKFTVKYGFVSFFNNYVFGLYFLN